MGQREAGVKTGRDWLRVRLNELSMEVGIVRQRPCQVTDVVCVSLAGKQEAHVSLLLLAPQGGR